MRVIQKTDLTNNYNYNELKKSRTKQLKKWMWLVLLGCFLFQMLPYCVALNLTNVFVGSDWKIWTGGNQTITGLTFTAGALAAAIAGPFIAKIFSKKINMRIVYAAGVILAMIGFAGSGINSIIMHCNGGVVPDKVGVAAILWISNIISQIGVMIFSGLGVNNLISKWWPAEKRGFALGIAFAGGSLGNIWMQQLVGALGKIFGNNISKDNYYNYAGNQYATYIIMASIGLVAGILIVLFVCRKPLPTIDILDDSQFNKSAKGIKIDNKSNSSDLEVSPLYTKKYPPYWILAIGFLILQMGTVHASSNGIFVANGVLFNNSSLGTYNSVMANGGTIFGVCCLIGNTCGGILNDKLGPWKSIFLAGMVQCLAIICLMFSPGTPALVYVYFALAGLSVYVYTSTPSFISGRLYGPKQSNNHMAILGIFIAVGFAIVNSISGSLTGNINDSSNINYMFGYKTIGNLQALGLFALACMGVGTIIVVICCFIIQSKGIKGLIEYSPTKYSKVIFKHSFMVNFNANKILVSKNDFRKSKKWINKINEQKSKDMYFNSIKDFSKAINNELKQYKLSKQELVILSNIYYFKYVNCSRLQKIFKYTSKKDINNYNKSLNSLVNKNLINEISLGQLSKYYKLDDSILNDLKTSTEKLFNKYSLIKKSNISVQKNINKLNEKLKVKINKLQKLLIKANNITINQEKKDKLISKMNKKELRLNSKKPKTLAKYKNKSQWLQYQQEYNLISQIINCENNKDKFDNQKQAKIFAIQKKIAIANYVNNFSKNQQIDGHYLLLNYYNNKYKVINELITNKVNYKISIKVDLEQNKLNKLKNKQEYFKKLLS